MAKYKVQHDYRSYRDGVQHGFSKGAEVELSEDQAEYFNLDSPGLLTLVRHVEASPNDRARKGPGRTR